MLDLRIKLYPLIKLFLSTVVFKTSSAVAIIKLYNNAQLL